MRYVVISLIFLACLQPTAGYAQYQEMPHPDLKFCGMKYKDTSIIRRDLASKLDFFNIRDNDTIVDIGSSSGAYAGALSVINNKKNVHFMLVDIDSGCLNINAVNNMLAYFEKIKKSPLNITIDIVNNTEDSLWLPLHSFSKLWIINTLHEIPVKSEIARQIAGVTRLGGELIVAELLATEKSKIHQGCKKALMSAEEIENTFINAGFMLKEFVNLQITKEKDKHPYCFFRFIKQ